MKVLYVASVPVGEKDIRQQAEIFEIQRRFSDVGAGANFSALSRVLIEELSRELRKYAPHVLHLSAHGETEQLAFSKGDGQPVALTADALLDLLPTRHPPLVVFVNACRSAAIAERLIERVPVAIGCETNLTNRAARAAATVFYEQLLSGETIASAASQAKRLVQMIDGRDSLRVFFKDEHVKQLTPYQIPTIVARFYKNKIKYDDDGFKDFEVGLRFAPADTVQVVFFTDDEESAESAGRKISLESALCLVARKRPLRGGSLWCDDLWPEWGDIRLFAAGITGTGGMFTASSTLSGAIDDYYRLLGQSPSDKIADAIAELRARDGSEEDQTPSSNHKGQKPKSGRSAVAAEAEAGGSSAGDDEAR